jgi:GDPmannose 4,6-dehydratase
VQQRRALICGVTGQDGAYLAALLLAKGYEVAGTSRSIAAANSGNLDSLGIAGRVRLESMIPTDFGSVAGTVARIEPTEIYNLAGESSAVVSFEHPAESIASIAHATLNLLEAIRISKSPIRFFNAGSADCYGDVGGSPVDESSPFRPRSPYAVAKAAAFWEVANYRESYGIHASTGILFNHESPLRSEHFVTQKIVSAACRIAAGSKERLRLGNLAAQRDWGWAPEFVEAMWRMLQHAVPQDFVIATGETVSVERFVELAFEAVGLRWRDHVDVGDDMFRPFDIPIKRANPDKAARVLGWRAGTRVEGVVRGMIEARLASSTRNAKR